ncbi:MAG: aldehyde dehydrogenase family protein [Planctomycetota bacterium]|jgi:hypothetical protein|nr:aldehyde dehydrogenase family protein [Planctomycetota bacterium]MDP6989348.1 aldehyde dehydrogenase family protein [Planctomycetota bacterium]
MAEVAQRAGAVSEAVGELCRGRETLASSSLDERIRLIDRLTTDTAAAACEWVAVSCAAKGIDPNSPTASEEWLAGPVSVLRNLRLLRRSLAHIARHRRPLLADREVFLRGDTTVARVFPEVFSDRLVLTGFTAEIRMEPGVTPENLRDTMARPYLDPAGIEPGISAVLGAGNVSSIGPQDVLQKLFAENRVCALKMNPVNDYLAPVFERAFAAVVEAGFLRILDGGAEVGAELVHHDEVCDVHMTGSQVVHDAIVWGTGDEGEANRSAGTPVLDKPITSELGCVTPFILVPGVWTKREIAFQAANVATMLTNNASFNCNAAKVLVTAEGWAQREQFLAELGRALERIQPRLAYYPGAEQRHERFISDHPGARSYGERGEDRLPWAVAPGVDPAADDPTAFGIEAWCGVLAETALPANDAAEFLPAAVRFCNERLYGTLSCGIAADPRTRAEVAGAFDLALEELRYGSIGVNHWPALSYAMGVTTWGAAPGHTIEDVQSGIGFVHNTRLFGRPHKSVVEGPFCAPILPLWFAGHRRALPASEALARYEANPGPGRLLAVARHALRP